MPDSATLWRCDGSIYGPSYQISDSTFRRSEMLLTLDSVSKLHRQMLFQYTHISESESHGYH